MAVATMDTYTQVGKVEEVSDLISIITPAETPALTMFGSEKTDNIDYSWLEDALDAPTSNAQLEGATAPAASMTPPARRSGTTQIFTKTAQVTGSAQAMKMYGVGGGGEMGRQMAKKSKEIKRDVEWSLVQTRQTGVTGSTGVARQFTSVQAQHLSANTLANGGTLRALTEALFLQAAQLAKTNGSDCSIALIKFDHANTVTNWAYATGRMREIAGEKKLVNVVDVYQGPFGTQKFVQDQWINAKDLILMDPAMWKLRPYRPWFTKQLPEMGDYSAKEIIGEYGLSHRNYLDGVLLTDLS